MARQGKARQGKARQGKAREGKAREGKGRQERAREGKGREGKGKASQTKTTQDEIGQGSRRQDNTRQKQTMLLIGIVPESLYRRRNRDMGIWRNFTTSYMGGVVCTYRGWTSQEMSLPFLSQTSSARIMELDNTMKLF